MVRAVIDSGAEINVVRDGVAPEMKGSSGRVTLTGAFGDNVSAALRHMPMTLPTSYVEYVSQEVPLLCAVNEQLGNGINMLLTPDDYDNPGSGCRMPDFELVNLEPEDEKDEEEALEAPGGCIPEAHGETRERLCGFKIKPRGPSPTAKEHTPTGSYCENEGPHGDTKNFRRDGADRTQGYRKASSCSRHGGSQAWDAVVSERPTQDEDATPD
ncbi:hypothetical protein HPB47_019550 [Ixodes persulcatus]|uniref:Uncharacterized protein n=1 Tax=Ixodes persulcatus TaxID=34615 RepID=A0AC60R216_IXOPE|nr:hypothetical protein HPB47_019550 [Ixodes persulcatus]